MGENSKIEWTDHTFNPWMGCTKVSPGCQHCYAERDMDLRWGKVKWGPAGERKRTSAAKWREPLKWNREAKERGIRFRVFCASLADVFEDRPELIEWRRDLFRLMDDTPHLDWLLLTKRPENVCRMVGQSSIHSSVGKHFDIHFNQWIGTTVEDQQRANERIPHLLRCPAAVRFLSCEPLLGPVDLDSLWPGGMPGPVDGPYVPSIHWVIVGGESGNDARPMHPDWARSIRNQCEAADVPFHFKQWGEWIAAGQVIEGHGPDGPYHRWPDGAISSRIGKHRAGRLLDGRTWDGFPVRASAVA